MSDNFIDLTISSDEEPREPEWRVRYRRAIARLSLRPLSPENASPAVGDRHAVVDAVPPLAAPAAKPQASRKSRLNTAEAEAVPPLAAPPVVADAAPPVAAPPFVAEHPLVVDAVPPLAAPAAKPQASRKSRLNTAEAEAVPPLAAPPVVADAAPPVAAPAPKPPASRQSQFAATVPTDTKRVAYRRLRTAKPPGSSPPQILASAQAAKRGEACGDDSPSEGVVMAELQRMISDEDKHGDRDAELTLKRVIAEDGEDGDGSDASAALSAMLLPTDELYQLWHGDRSHSESATQFDWHGIRKRAKLCRDKIDSAAGARAEDIEGEAEGVSTVHASSDVVDREDDGDWTSFFRWLKQRWVTTSRDGMPAQEYRAPDRSAQEWRVSSHKSAPKKPQTLTSKRPLNGAPRSTKITAPKSDVPPSMSSALAAAVHADDTQPPPHPSLASRRVVVRRSLQGATPPPQFFIKRWPSNIISLRAMFNPSEVKFAYETPFAGVCECVFPCRQTTCPNGILGIFCNAACCKYKGKCGNGLAEQEGLRLARRRGSAQLAVITTKMFDAGEVLGEYLGEVQVVTDDMKRDHASKGTEEHHSAYRYEMKRAAESHPSDTIYIDAQRMGGITRFMNHSCVPAAEFHEVRNGRIHTVVVITSRELRLGEEVTVNYGSRLWFTCECGEPSCQHRHLRNKQP